MKDVLKKLGFNHMTGVLWKHEIIGIIQVDDNDTPSSIAEKIYQRGYGECQTVIKSSLGIKPN